MARHAGLVAGSRSLAFRRGVQKRGTGGCRQSGGGESPLAPGTRAQKVRPFAWAAARSRSSAYWLRRQRATTARPTSSPPSALRSARSGAAQPSDLRRHSRPHHLGWRDVRGGRRDQIPPAHAARRFPPTPSRISVSKPKASLPCSSMGLDRVARAVHANVSGFEQASWEEMARSMRQAGRTFALLLAAAAAVSLVVGGIGVSEHHARFRRRTNARDRFANGDGRSHWRRDDTVAGRHAGRAQRCHRSCPGRAGSSSPGMACTGPPPSRLECCCSPFRWPPQPESSSGLVRRGAQPRSIPS